MLSLAQLVEGYLDALRKKIPVVTGVVGLRWALLENELSWTQNLGP